MVRHQEISRSRRYACRCTTRTKVPTGISVAGGIFSPTARAHATSEVLPAGPASKEELVRRAVTLREMTMPLIVDGIDLLEQFNLCFVAVRGTNGVHRLVCGRTAVISMEERLALTWWPALKSNRHQHMSYESRGR